MIIHCILSSLLMAASFPAATFSQDDPPPIIIDIGEDPGDPNGNRSPVYVPISCYYYPSLSAVTACFLYSLDSVTVEIENLTTGAYSTQIIDGSYGAHVIPFNDESGSYRITFTLIDGTEYTGEFIIS